MSFSFVLARFSKFSSTSLETQVGLSYPEVHWWYRDIYSHYSSLSCLIVADHLIHTIFYVTFLDTTIISRRYLLKVSTLDWFHQSSFVFLTLFLNLAYAGYFPLFLIISLTSLRSGGCMDQAYCANEVPPLCLLFSWFLCPSKRINWYVVYLQNWLLDVLW